MAVKHNLILQIFHTIKLAYTKQSLIYIVKNEIGSLSRILDFFKIPNLTIRLKPYQLSEITLPAIAHCQTPKESYFVLLQSFTISQVVYYHEDKGEVTEALEAFAEKWSGTYGSLTDCLNAVGVSGGCNCKSTSK